MNWHLEPLRKYAVFNGRARRKEFWHFTVFVFAIGFVFAFIDVITGTFNPSIGLGLTTSIFLIAFFIPGLAVTVRRLHDIGISGWFALISFFPYVGQLIIFVLMLLDSKPGANKYGENPKEFSD